MVGEAQIGSLAPALPPGAESVRIDDPFQRKTHGFSESPDFMARREERDKGWQLYLLAWIPLT